MKERPNFPKAYLSDSVYAEFDGWAVTIWLDNGTGEQHSQIVLEPEVIAALVRFYDTSRANMERNHDQDS